MNVLFFDDRRLFWNDNLHKRKPDLGSADIILRQGLNVAAEFLQVFLNYLNCASTASSD